MKFSLDLGKTLRRFRRNSDFNQLVDKSNKAPCDDENNIVVDQRSLRKWFPAVLSVAMGTIIFFVFYGSNFLFGVTPYLSAPTGDIAAEMAGYYHFANDGWRFPIFGMPLINVPEGSNALFTGGVPLLALLVKVIRKLFGWTPNLFGAWYLLCCVLQTHSLYFLMRQITDKRPLLLGFASAIAGLTYAFLSRTGHVSLFCHFFCIYAVGFVIATTNSNYKPRVILLALAALVYLSMFVFAYLAICNTVMFFAAVASLWQQRKIDLKEAIVSAAIFVLIVLGLSYIGGYFWAIGKAAPAALGGFQLYGLNLGSLFSPPRSILFPNRSFWQAWWEGNFYFGIGIIVLWVILICTIPKKLCGSVRRHWPIALALLLLTIVSLSTRISFLDYVVVDFEPPKILTPIIGMARTAGRLFWPVGYLLIGGAISLTVANFHRTGPLLVLAAIVMALIEATGSYDFVTQLTTNERLPPIDYSDLQNAMNGHDSLKVYPTLWCSPNLPLERLIAYQQIEFTSARAGLASNSTITARQIKDCKLEASRANSIQLSSGELVVLMDRSVVRIGVPDNVRETFLNHCRLLTIGTDKALMCALDWKRNADHQTVSMIETESLLNINEHIDFGKKSNRDWFITKGWSAAEQEFSWSDGNISELEFKLPATPEELSIELELYPYLSPPQIAARNIVVRIDNVVITKWIFDVPGWQTKRILIPIGLQGQNIQVSFEQEDTRSPKDLNLSEDPRHIGLAVKQLKLLKAQ